MNIFDFEGWDVPWCHLLPLDIFVYISFYQMADLRAEVGVLARTADILQNQYNEVKQTIVSFFIQILICNSLTWNCQIKLNLQTYSKFSHAAPYWCWNCLLFLSWCIVKNTMIAFWRTISARTGVFTNTLLEIIIQSAPQAQMEKERGIAGYTDTQDQLEMISAAKGETDEKKGQILEDMSDMVRWLFDSQFLNFDTCCAVYSLNIIRINSLWSWKGGWELAKPCDMCGALWRLDKVIRSSDHSTAMYIVAHFFQHSRELLLGGVNSLIGGISGMDNMRFVSCHWKSSGSWLIF